MKYILSLLILITIFNCSFSQPKIEIIGGKDFDFGDIFAGSKVEKIVTIKNSGKDTLIISNVRASCGCTATLLSDKVLPPKKTATLNIGFDSRGFNGKVHKTVTISSNDNANPDLQISFTANIVSLLTFDPPYIYFQQLKPDSVASLRISVKNNTQETIEIKSIQNKITGLTVDILQRKLMPQESTQINITFTAISEGMLQGDVIFNTNHKKQPQVPLRFFAFVRK
ncbi:MAG: hypothetical protein IGBAC_1858 [Ignavibacteriae bacterium]|nr:MAG: hypothetical protein IGBAC_1858 [Ignavibacteriota bacterium]